MKIILSPAKKMKVDTDSIDTMSSPVFLEKTEEILGWMQGRTEEELKKLWKCNDKITTENIERIKTMNFQKQLTPAVLAYEGIAYQYMAPAVFEDGHFDYVQEHLRILSAFYGVLKPMDGITPYRLEMQAKAAIGDSTNLYDFWGDNLYWEVIDDRYITISFCEQSGGRLITKGTYAKMARGEMVRYMAENHIENPDDIKEFDHLGYVFRDDISSDREYIFERKTVK